MNNQIVLVSMQVDDLHNLIAEAVATGLKFHKGEKIEPSETELLLDKRESAKLLNCSVSTIDSMRRNGTLEPIYIGGRKGAVRFRKGDLLKFINK